MGLVGALAYSSNTGLLSDGFDPRTLELVPLLKDWFIDSSVRLYIQALSRRVKGHVASSQSLERFCMLVARLRAFVWWIFISWRSQPARQVGIGLGAFPGNVALKKVPTTVMRLIDCSICARHVLLCVRLSVCLLDCFFDSLSACLSACISLSVYVCGTLCSIHAKC